MTKDTICKKYKIYSINKLTRMLRIELKALMITFHIEKRSES
jgi:hypothetical protein